MVGRKHLPHRTTDPVAMPALATLLLTSATRSAATLLEHLAEHTVSGKTAARKPGDAEKKTPEAANLATTFAATLAAAAFVQAAPTPVPSSGTAATPKEPEKTEKTALTTAATAAIAAVPKAVPSLPSVVPPVVATPSAATIKPAAPISSPLPAIATAKPAAPTNSPPPTVATIKPAAPTNALVSTAAASVRLAATEITPKTTATKATGLPASAKPPQPETTAPIRAMSHPFAGGHGEKLSIPPSEHEQPGVHNAPPSLLTVPAPEPPGGTDAPALVSAPRAAAAALSAPPSVNPQTGREVHTPAAGPILLDTTERVPEATTANVHATPPLGIVIANGIGNTKPAVVAASIPPDRPRVDSNDPPPPSNGTTPAQTPVVSAVAVGGATESVKPESVRSADNAPAPPVSEQLTRAIAARVDPSARDGRTNFHLRLEPPQLGTVQIHLRATDHAVSARVVVALEGTRQLLEGQAHQLRQSLAQAGLSLTGFDVSRDSSGSGGRQPPPEPPLPIYAAAVPRPAVPPKISAPHRVEGIDILA